MGDGFVAGVMEPLDAATRRANAMPDLGVMDAALLGVLRELQGFKLSVVTGAGVSTNIAVTGITTVDPILTVIGFDSTASPASAGCVQYANFAVTSDGNIQSVTSTTGKMLVVYWFDKA